MERQTGREEIYDGKVIKVVKDTVQTDDSRLTKREVVLHRGGVCIALKDKDQFYLVKQYRYAQQKEMLEFCAGKIEKDEDPDEAILRETVEELGYEADNVKRLGMIIPTCGYSSEKIYLYYGEKGREVGQHFDEFENIRTYRYSFDELEEMVRNGEIDDAKTIALLYQLRLAHLDK